MKIKLRNKTKYNLDINVMVVNPLELYAGDEDTIILKNKTGYIVIEIYEKGGDADGS